MDKIIKSIKNFFSEMFIAQKELKDMGLYIVPHGYSYVIMYIDPESIKQYNN